ncbi:MAG TPA: class II aldolase/adducin family protein [Steroidobacteraceae bacterium]
MAHLTALSSRSAAELETRITLAACFRLIAHFGMDDLVYTHVSARVPGRPNNYLINPFGTLFHEITASSLVEIDHDGNIVGESAHSVNKAGMVIHGAVHQARPDVNCVVHTHSRGGVAVSCLQEGFLHIHQRSLMFFGRLGYHDYEGLAFEEDEQPRLARDLAEHPAIILRNHGLLTVGRTIPEAFTFMYYLEQCCRIQIDLMATGRKLIPLPEAVCRRGAEQFEEFAQQHWEREWSALLRLVDAKDPSYRN